jgi:predicted N-acetyltransferase YhbS
VDAAWHRRGVGRALMNAVEQDLSQKGVEFVQVKTLGPSYPSPEYEGGPGSSTKQSAIAASRIHGLWPDNPCSILIKRLCPAG